MTLSQEDVAESVGTLRGRCGDMSRFGDDIEADQWRVCAAQAVQEVTAVRGGDGIVLHAEDEPHHSCGIGELPSVRYNARFHECLSKTGIAAGARTGAIAGKGESPSLSRRPTSSIQRPWCCTSSCRHPQSSRAQLGPPSNTTAENKGAEEQGGGGAGESWSGTVDKGEGGLVGDDRTLGQVFGAFAREASDREIVPGGAPRLETVGGAEVNSSLLRRGVHLSGRSNRGR